MVRLKRRAMVGVVAESQQGSGLVGATVPRLGERGFVPDNDRKRILVVNDTQEILTLFRDILEGEGYEVHLYSFAFDDLSVVKAVRPDLVILDLLIGNDAQGWQLLQKLKLDRETASIPVIVCSAAINLLRELQGRLTEKNVGIVPKPFDIDDLLKAIDEAWCSIPGVVRAEILREPVVRP